jgi:triacylglycerol lipase
MRPRSDFLRDLDRDADALRRVGFTSLWTPLDLTILPAKSSVVPAADCRRVWGITHNTMILQPRCKKAVLEALE